MLGADLHNANLVSEAGVLAGGVNALLVVADLLVAAAGDHVGSKSHVLGVLHGGRAETTVLVAEGLGLAVGVPVVVGLVVSMPLLERVIQVSVQPIELGNHAHVERHLSVLVRLVVVSLTDGVKLLVEIGMDDLVTQVVVGLLPIVLWQVGRVEASIGLVRWVWDLQTGYPSHTNTVDLSAVQSH